MHPGNGSRQSPSITGQQAKLMLQGVTMERLELSSHPQPKCHEEWGSSVNRSITSPSLWNKAPYAHTVTFGR